MVRLSENGRRGFIRYYDRWLIYSKSIKRRKAEQGRMRLLLLSRHFIPPLDTRFELKSFGYFHTCTTELNYFSLWGGCFDKRRDSRLMNVMLKLLLKGFAGSPAELTLRLSLPQGMTIDCLMGKRIRKALIVCKESGVPIRIEFWNCWLNKRKLPDPYGQMVIDLFGDQMETYKGRSINAPMFYWRAKPLRKVRFESTDGISAATLLKVPAESIEFQSKFVTDCADDIRYPPNPHLKRLIIPINSKEPLDVEALRAGLRVLRGLNPEMKIRMCSWARFEEKVRNRSDDSDDGFGGETRAVLIEKVRDALQTAKQYIDASIDLFPSLEFEMCGLSIRFSGKKDPSAVREYAEAVGFEEIKKSKYTYILKTAYAGALIRVPVFAM